MNLVHENANVTLTRMTLDSGYQIMTRIHCKEGSNLQGSSLLIIDDIAYIATHDLHQIQLYQYNITKNTVYFYTAYYYSYSVK